MSCPSERAAPNVPTLKAACDGPVDSGIVPNGIPAYMNKRMPVVVHRPGVRQSLEQLVEVIA